jgi:hypothetical protein
MSGMRVIDAHVYIGCRHFPPLKMYHHLTMAGIAGAMFLAGPENRDLPCGSTGTSGVNDRWRHPRYLTRRGTLHSQQYPYSWLPPIPATPLHLGCISRSHRFSPCDALSSKSARSLLADGNERLAQGLRKRTCLSSLSGRLHGVYPCFSTRLLSIPTPTVSAPWGVASRRWSEVSLLVSRRVVPADPLAIWSGVRRVLGRQVVPQEMLEALHWRDMSQLLQQSEVTQRR